VVPVVSCRRLRLITTDVLITAIVTLVLVVFASGGGGGGGVLMECAPDKYQKVCQQANLALLTGRQPFPSIWVGPDVIATVSRRTAGDFHGKHTAVTAGSLDAVEEHQHQNSLQLWCC